MRNHSLKMALLAAGVFCASVLPVGAASAESFADEATAKSDPWSFDIVPYLWLATYSGSFDLPGIPEGFARNRTTSSSAYSTHISAGAMLLAQVHYREFGLYLDGVWAQLSTEGNADPALYSGTDIKTDLAYGTAALTYRLPPFGKLKSEVIAGARVWYVGNEIELISGTAQGFTTDDSRTWSDPIIGASLRYEFTRHWYVVALGDAGGFGVGSDLSWNVYGGVGYQFTRCVSATLGYRYLHLDYSQGRFVVNADVQGAVLGVGFHF